MILRCSNQAQTCNSFPKIIGGSGGNTFVYNFDVFADYIALCGRTHDISIAPAVPAGNYLPFIALTSVNIPDKYYWIKVMSLNINKYCNGIQFSNDGNLLIINVFSSASSIVAIKVGTGEVLSARSYSSNGF